jgi:hypothetical protein
LTIIFFPGLSELTGRLQDILDLLAILFFRRRSCRTLRCLLGNRSVLYLGYILNRLDPFRERVNQVTTWPTGELSLCHD